MSMFLVGARGKKKKKNLILVPRPHRHFTSNLLMVNRREEGDLLAEEGISPSRGSGTKCLKRQGDPTAAQVKKGKRGTEGEKLLSMFRHPSKIS